MNKLEEKEPRALRLWGEILKTRLETGEPYLMFEDNINNANPQAYKNFNLNVSMTNICSEIALYTDPLHSFICCLSSLNLARWDEWKNVEGVLRIQSSSLQEVSLVTDPAIDSARVAEVAASQTPENSEATAEETTTEENKVSEINSEAPIATEAVEAAQAPTVTANYVAYTKPRVDLDVTAGQFLTAQVRAIQGDTDARDLVAALQIATVSENTGTVPPNYLRDAIGIIDSSRPFIESIERAPLPATGMKIFTPVLGTKATVAQTGEGVEFSSTDTSVTYQEDSVVKFAGANVVNVELFDRSSVDGGSFADLLVRELAASYAQKTDAYAARIAADGADSSTGSTLYKSIADGIADSYGVMRFTPNKLLVAPSGGYVNIVT